MPIQAQSADGQIHEFPDHTPDAVIDNAMKAYAAEKEPPSSLMDAARSVPGGIVKGITGLAGLPGTLSDAASGGLDYLANKVTGANVNTANNPLSGQVLSNIASQPTGGFYKPQTTAGKYAETAAEFAPAALGGGPLTMGKLLGRVAAPAIGSETAGQVTAGTPYEGVARLTGAVLGGSPALVSTGARAMANALTSKMAGSLPAEDAALVSKYEGMGGHLRPGQYSPSNFIRQGDSVLADTPFPKVSGFSADSQHAVLPGQQVDEYNRFLSKTFGEDAPRITDKVIQDAHDRIGKVYKEVLPRNNVTTDEPLTSALGKVEENLGHAAPAMDSKDALRVQNVLEGLRTQLASGSIPGKLYQTYRERGGLLDEMAGSSSPTVQKAGQDIRNALDDAFARQANEWDAPVLKSAREQYRNLKTIEPLAAKAPTGAISPGLVLNAVNKEFGNPGAAGDLGTLARVGNAFLKSTANSGTSERTVWRSILNKPFSEGAPALFNKAISLPISAVGGRAINSAINSPQMRQKLLAQALQQAPAQAPQSAAQLGALLAGKP